MSSSSSEIPKKCGFLTLHPVVTGYEEHDDIIAILWCHSEAEIKSKDDLKYGHIVLDILSDHERSQLYDEDSEDSLFHIVYSIFKNNHYSRTFFDEHWSKQCKNFKLLQDKDQNMMVKTMTQMTNQLYEKIKEISSIYDYIILMIETKHAVLIENMLQKEKMGSIVNETQFIVPKKKFNIMSLTDYQAGVIGSSITDPHSTYVKKCVSYLKLTQIIDEKLIDKSNLMNLAICYHLSVLKITLFIKKKNEKFEKKMRDLSSKRSRHS